MPKEIKEKIEEEYQLRFIEYQTYFPFAKTHIAGRIEIYKIGGDIEKDKEEIGTIKLPIEIWRKLKEKLDGFKF